MPSAPRWIERTPVRDSSTSPSGRISSTKLSTFDGAPVISNTKLSEVVSTTLARKMSDTRRASTRSVPVPRTLTRASSRSMPRGSRVTSCTRRTLMTFDSWASIWSSTCGAPRVTMVIRLVCALRSVSATVRLSML
jgi:hypothetical protein